MLKERGAALFIDAFIMMLFNSMVMYPLFESNVSFVNYKSLVLSVSGFFLGYFLFIFFAKGTPGALFVGIDIVKRGETSWLFSYFKRYSYFIVFYLWNICFMCARYGTVMEAVDGGMTASLAEVLFEPNLSGLATLVF